jgi:hypothetical protein
MSYNICAKCVGADGVIGTTIYECACVVSAEPRAEATQTQNLCVLHGPYYGVCKKCLQRML